MNVNLNLASKPFNNRVLPWVLTVAILFVSLVGLIFVFKFSSSARNEAQLVQAEVNTLKQSEQALLSNAEAVKKS